MDLRTKLVLVLVTFSLVSMAALGVFAFNSVEELLTRRTLRQLNALAEAELNDLESVVDGWRDRVTLVASRTQLRLSLRSWNRTGDPEDRRRIQRILADARSASATIRTLTVYDDAGRLVARTGPEGAGEPIVLDHAARPAPDSGVVFGGISLEEDEPAVEFGTALTLDRDRIGSLRATLSTSELVEITEDYTGLGATGEVMIALRDSTGRIRVLHPVRFRGAAADFEHGSGPGDDPLERAFRGEEGPFTRGLVDYRGASVWAATRLLPALGWGLVVKFDESEERASVLEFRDRLVWVGFSLSAFAILLGILLGLRIARPIHELAEVATRLGEGDLGARAAIESEDELGLLARTFNGMAEEMERRMTLLREYKTFFEVSPDMLCIAGTDGFFKRVNPAFERILGWSSEELLDRPFVEFVHPDDVEQTLRETEKLSRGLPTVRFENRYRLPDGGYARLRWTCHPDPETGLLYAIARRLPDERRV